MSGLMHGVRRGGCKCCNDWAAFGRNIDKAETRREIGEEAPFIPIWIDPRFVR